MREKLIAIFSDFIASWSFVYGREQIAIILTLAEGTAILSALRAAVSQEKAVQLAELVLSMDLITENGLYARHIARTILESREHAPSSEDTEIAALRAENAKCKTMATELEAKLFALSGAGAALTVRGVRIHDLVDFTAPAAEIREKRKK